MLAVGFCQHPDNRLSNPRRRHPALPVSRCEPDNDKYAVFRVTHWRAHQSDPGRCRTRPAAVDPSHSIARTRDGMDIPFPDGNYRSIRVWARRAVSASKSEAPFSGIIRRKSSIFAECLNPPRLISRFAQPRGGSFLLLVLQRVGKFSGSIATGAEGSQKRWSERRLANRPP
jgi:hypothetical protein